MRRFEIGDVVVQVWKEGRDCWSWHHVLCLMLGGKALQIYIWARWVIWGYAILVNLWVRWQFGKEWFELARVVLGDGLSWVDARAPRQNVKIVLECRDHGFLLPVIFNHFMARRVQIKQLGEKIIVSHPLETLFNYFVIIRTLPGVILRDSCFFSFARMGIGSHGFIEINQVWIYPGRVQFPLREYLADLLVLHAIESICL